MPTFSLTLSPAAVQRLQAIVARYNADNGTALTVQEWLLLHIKEIAIQDELMAAVEQARKAAEQAAVDAIKAERQRLLDGV